jgi:hypothetical protein
MVPEGYVVDVVDAVKSVDVKTVLIETLVLGVYTVVVPNARKYLTVPSICPYEFRVEDILLIILFLFVR